MKPQVIFVTLAILLAVFIELFTLLFTSVIGNGYLRLLALPAGLIILLVFLIDKTFFFWLIVIFRASLDNIFNAFKIGAFGLGAVLNALVIVLAFLMLIDKNRTNLDIKLDSVWRAWIYFLLLSFISVLHSPDFVASFKVFLIYVSYASLFTLGLYSVRTENDHQKWIRAIFLSSLIPVLYGLISATFGIGGARLSIGEGFRVQSTFPHPNAFAFYLVFIISVTFFIYKSKDSFIPQKLKKYLPIYIIALIGLLLMTKTRSAWIACYIYFFLYGLFFERKFLVWVLLAPFAALLIPTVQDRFMDLQGSNTYSADGYGRLNSYAWRKQVWSEAVNWMTPAHYLFGYGVSSFIHYSTSFIMANEFEKMKVEINAHSVYVQLFFELGVTGVIAFLNLIFVNIKVLFSLFNKNKLLVFTVVSLVIEFLFECYSDNMLDYLIYQWYQWFIVGLTISGLTKIKLADSKEEKRN